LQDERKWADAGGSARRRTSVEPNVRRDPMRPVLSLLIGIVISVLGLWVVVATDLDIPGVLLIAAGVVVALLGVRTGRARSTVD
jgi:hypothetical protein